MRQKKWLILRCITGNYPTIQLILLKATGNYLEINKEIGDFRKAYEYKEKERTIIDSIRNVEKTKQVTELEKKYNQAKNEKTIKELDQQKRIYLLLIIVAFLAIISFGFYLTAAISKT